MTSLLALMLLAFASCDAQIKNAKTETFKVYGNCGMCKKTIEKAVGKSNQAKGVWDKDTKMLTLTYNSKKTTPDVVLKRIADAGYDNQKYEATMAVYNKLPECCQYERKLTAK